MVSYIAIVLVIGAVGLVIGAPQANRVLTNSVTASTTASTSSSSPVAPVQAQNQNVQNVTAPAVDDYLKGMTTFDANLMWRSLSPDAITQMTQQGNTVQQLQQNLNQAKQAGARYESITYIGGFPLTDGEKYLFYVVSRRGFSGPGVLEQVYFVFTVGADGKIVQIQ